MYLMILIDVVMKLILWTLWMSLVLKTYCSMLQTDKKKNWDCWHKEIKKKRFDAQ